MSTKVLEIVERLKSLSLIETTELVKKVKETFNIDNSRFEVKYPFIIDHIYDNQEVDNQQTEFDVILEEFPAHRKIEILKIVRGITGFTLKDTKSFVDSVPQTVKSGIAIAEAEKIKEQLEAAEAKVSIK